MTFVPIVDPSLTVAVHKSYGRDMLLFIGKDELSAAEKYLSLFDKSPDAGIETIFFTVTIPSLNHHVLSRFDGKRHVEREADP